MRKMTLRMFAAATALALSWGLAGCGGSPAAESSPATESSGTSSAAAAAGDLLVYLHIL